MPQPADLVAGTAAAELPDGGESVGRRRLDAWVTDRLAGYDDHHDDLAGDRTSRLSPYLHFGCLSPLEVAERARGLPGAEPFLRQLAWRDFHHQVNGLARTAERGEAVIGR